MTLGGLPLTPDGQVRSVWSAERLYLLIISLLGVVPKILGHFWGLDLPGLGKNRQKKRKIASSQAPEKSQFWKFWTKMHFLDSQWCWHSKMALLLVLGSLEVDLGGF